MLRGAPPAAEVPQPAPPPFDIDSPDFMPLEHDLAGRFDLRTHFFRHGDFAVELIAPRSPDELIDVSDFNVDERLPYWAELWPSARALTAHLLDAPPPRGSVMELGCGLALPSLALRARGVNVVASDYYPEALDFARANALRNSLEPPRTLLLDWRDPPADAGRFDLLLAADVLYEQRNADSLASLIPRLASATGHVLLADPGRSYVTHFRDLMGAQDWTMTEVARRPEPAPEPGGPPINVRFYTVSRG